MSNKMINYIVVNQSLIHMEINEEKIKKFIQLQTLANKQIDDHGQAETKTVDELEQVGNSLNEAEQTQMLKRFENREHCKCLFEIQNDLPRTQFCTTPCKGQRNIK